MPFDGSYPAVPGNKRVSVLDVAGPASYTQVTISAGVAPTGGQAVSASAFGLSGLEYVHSMRSDDGIYQVLVYMAPFQKNNPSPGVILAWFVASTGVQVTALTNLSARTVRLAAQGSY